MKLSKSNADVFTPSGEDADNALKRTTHLCIAAHQDDIEILAFHGIAECFRAPDKSFAGVVVTTGAGSPRNGPYRSMTDNEMQQIRRIEQRNAASIGLYGVQIQLDFASSEVKDSTAREVRDDIRSLIEEAQPDVLYCHNPFDKHDTHVAVFLRTLEAILELPLSKRPRKFLGGEVWRSLDWVSDEEKVPLATDEYESLASALLGVFDSQVSGGKRYDLATIGRRMSNATYGKSHETDATRGVSWAVDLGPLIAADPISVEAYVDGYMSRLKQDVTARIKRFS